MGGKNVVGKSLITSRGCPYRCTFCAVHRDRKPHYIDAIKVVDELEMLEKDYGASFVYIMDELFISSKDRVFEICDEIRERKLKIKWGATAHINYITPELIREIASAGCYEISFGIESGVQRQLDRVKKGIKLSGVRDAIEMVKKNSDILISGLFILGLPGDSYADVVKTIQFAKSLPIDMAQFNVFTPYPGSPIFLKLAEKGELDTGIRGSGIDLSVWERYDAYLCFTKIEPIWVTENLTSARLRRLQKKALKEFYLRPVQIARYIKRIKPRNFIKSVRIFLSIL